MIRTFAIAITLASAAALAQSDLPERFGLTATAGIFDKIRSAPGFDLTKPAVFGYFFSSADLGKMRTIRERLESQGFQFVETHLDRNGRTWLQVAKAEIHSAETMVERNRQFTALATEVGAVQYDGWDITRNAQ